MTSKRFFDTEEWQERLKNGFQAMSRDDRRAFMNASWDEHLQQQYESSLQLMGHKGPAWSELTEEQKKNIERTVQEHAQAMQNFGEAIASGDADKMDEATRKLIGK